MQWNWLDVVIIALLGLSVLTGLIRGFVKELIALCVWILAIWLAITYSASLASYLQNYIHDKTVRAAIAFVSLLIATLIIGGLVNALLSFILKRSGLNGTDRILGMGFGFARGVFIVSLILLMLKITSMPYEQYTRDSHLYPRFAPIVTRLHELMPNVMQKIKLFEQPFSRQKTKKTVLLDAVLSQ
jgi:membrane protein required for colicin V production